LGDKINPNHATAPLLTGLLRAVGEAEYPAAALAYEQPAMLFTTLSQLTNLLSMTPTLIARLAPHLNLSQPNTPDLLTTDPTACQAIPFANATGSPENNYAYAPFISIFACAPLCPHAVVSIPVSGR
jgi:hypothetical protein